MLLFFMIYLDFVSFYLKKYWINNQAKITDLLAHCSSGFVQILPEGLSRSLSLTQYIYTYICIVTEFTYRYTYICIQLCIYIYIIYAHICIVITIYSRNKCLYFLTLPSVRLSLIHSFSHSKRTLFHPLSLLAFVDIYSFICVFVGTDEQHGLQDNSRDDERALFVPASSAVETENKGSNPRARARMSVCVCVYVYFVKPSAK